MTKTQLKAKAEAIHEIENISWKDKKTKQVADIVIWDEDLDKFVVIIDDIEYPYTWEEFYDKFVEEDNISFWKTIPNTPYSQEMREDAGWLTLIQGFALFDFYAERHEVKTNEVIGVQNYLKDRVEDVHFSIRNSMSLPWMTNLQDTGDYELSV